ncbi:hypothetical protein [Eilatimonas milleporae]|uniref:Uncharacterized protein n=1 Tax=Eilatimonas milleporae TaxID=911205 RepID=A0A3M0CTK1_9PROT|nr:hypothetical protein [Eilatimonas milleporae]RMB12285.1 hypothetical protein BXY39_0778 [Eilatimonas milleporae]
MFAKTLRPAPTLKFSELKCIVLAFIALHTLMPASARASDYFFRPVEYAAIGTWVPDLKFVLFNPSRAPILLRLSAARAGSEAGVLPAGGRSDTHVALKALPAQIFLMPGQRKTVSLDYRPRYAGDYGETGFVLTVEQQPVLYTGDGVSHDQPAMTVRNYTADITVRTTPDQPLMMAENIK